MSYSALLFDEKNQTRVSVLSGDAITDASLLPPFRVYVYRFRSSREAEVFIAGLRVSASNSVVYDWNPGTSESNRTVMVGVLSEEVDPSSNLHERVSLAVVPSGDHDQRASTAFMENLQAERRADRERQTEQMRPVLGAISALRPGKPDFGDGWMRVRIGTNMLTVSWAVQGGPYEIDMSALDLFRDGVDLEGTIVEMASSLGCRIGEGRTITTAKPVEDLAVLQDGVSTLVEALAAIGKRVKEENVAAWKRSVKMTAARRRFLLAALEGDGARLWTVRGMERARAQGETILRAEIDTLLRMGWIERKGAGLNVTVNGAEAARAAPLRRIRGA